jgi:rSAM/selenodomain-associated transferase 2
MKISVIVPTLNEEAVLSDSLTALVRHQSPDELIIADGGSTDRTLEIASRFGRVVSSLRGRARQLNEGARQAQGDILLFLHADTKLPHGGLEMVRKAVGSGQCLAGRFRMRFDTNDFLLKLYAAYTRFHCFSYGDQAFFLHRPLFESMGGFSETAPFEDIEFYKRLRWKTKPLIIKHPVTTSARRFLKMGRLRQKWINLLLIALYHMGMDVRPLKEKVYRDIR